MGGTAPAFAIVSRGPRLPLQHGQRNILRVYFALQQYFVDELQQLGGRAAAVSQCAQQTAHQSAVERRGGAFAAHIAKRENGEIAMFKEIVDVAADLACGAQANGDLETRDRRALRAATEPIAACARP